MTDFKHLHNPRDLAAHEWQKSRPFWLRPLQGLAVIAGGFGFLIIIWLWLICLLYTSPSPRD